MNARLQPFALTLDAAAEVERICAALRSQVLKRLRRKGAVLGLSGGVDSSVVAALSVRAFGAESVLGIFVPEQDSDPDSLRLGRAVAEWLGMPSVLEDVTPILAGAGCYRRRDEFIRRLIPEYGPGWRSKVVLRKARGTAGYNGFHPVGRGPPGQGPEARTPAEGHPGIVPTSHLNQRTPKQHENYPADR